MKKLIISYLCIVAVAACAGLIAGCGGGGTDAEASASTGKLTIAITDAPVAGAKPASS